MNSTRHPPTIVTFMHFRTCLIDRYSTASFVFCSSSACHPRTSIRPGSCAKQSISSCRFDWAPPSSPIICLCSSYLPVLPFTHIPHCRPNCFLCSCTCFRSCMHTSSTTVVNTHHLTSQHTFILSFFINNYCTAFLIQLKPPKMARKFVTPLRRGHFT